MKPTNRHDKPELLEKIDEYYEDVYGSLDDDDDDCYYEDYYDVELYDIQYNEFHNDGHNKWIDYVWLTSVDRAVAGLDNVKYFDGCEIYEYSDGTYEYEIYTYGAHSKLIAFFGLMMRIVKQVKKPSNHVKRIYNILCDRYPDIYIKLLDRV